jgi:hypothetical protein
MPELRGDVMERTFKPTYHYAWPPALMLFAHQSTGFHSAICIFAAGMWTAILLAYHLNWRIADTKEARP